MKTRTRLPAGALIVCALMLSLLLVLLADGARFFSPKGEERMLAFVLLEDMDATTAEAVLAEAEFSIDGSAPCPVLHCGEITADRHLETRSDGTILSLPSKRRFSAQITLLLEGKAEQDGFLAFGTRRILPGGTLRFDGERMTAKGRILSLAPYSGE